MGAPKSIPQDRPYICVFCGSQAGNDPAFLQLARDLAQQIHKHNGILIYGAGSTGIMGELSRTLVSLSGPDAVFGEVPENLVKRERPHDEEAYGRRLIVEDIPTRLSIMQAKVTESTTLGSGFVALPGGFGTLAEVLDVTVDAQIGRHDKPVVAISTGGFFRSLEEQSRMGVEKGMVREEGAAKLLVVATAEEAMECLFARSAV